MKPWLSVPAALCAFLLHVDAHAEDAKAQSFAYGITLTPREQNVLYAYTLPAEVLHALSDRDLGDLCVFDANGVERPLALHHARDSERDVIERDLPWFPLQADEAEQADEGLEVRVERDATGRIERAFSHALTPKDRSISALVDASGIEDAIVGLNLALSGPPQFTVRVQVDTSDDLVAFHTLTTATLAHLEHGGRTLSRDLVELPDARARYLRITVTPARGSSVLSLDTLSARIEREGSEPARTFLDLSPSRDEVSSRSVFTYRLLGVFDIDRYRIVLPANTALIEATLLSTSDPKTATRILDRGLFRHDDAARTLTRSQDGYYELHVSDKGGGIREGAPTLQLGYVAPQLWFVGDGAAPYTLAFGSTEARCRRFDEAELESVRDAGSVAELADNVTASPSRTLAGKTALEPQQPPTPIRLYALWAVLIAGVGVLAFVTRRLLRSMN